MITFSVTPIGVIHSPYKEIAGVPIQPVFAKGAAGTVELFEPYAAGLKDLSGFERIWLLYWLHQAPAARLMVTPFRDTCERGLFSTRAPARPNPIGISAVKLLGVEDRLLRVAGVDVLDGTPLIDIKPYVPEFDAHPVSRSGWLDNASASRTVSDERFNP